MLQLRQVLACFGGSEKLLIFASISKIYVSVCPISETVCVCVSEANESSCSIAHSECDLRLELRFLMGLLSVSQSCPSELIWQGQYMGYMLHIVCAICYMGYMLRYISYVPHIIQLAEQFSLIKIFAMYSLPRPGQLLLEHLLLLQLLLSSGCCCSSAFVGDPSQLLLAAC